ncbi:MAG TPA: OmpH family outer membrane protein [Blastocatellia bacterium]|nr:OmpH family outer membrane protein [Blastocatellia bacterium]
MKRLFPITIALCVLLSVAALAQTPNPPASRPAANAAPTSAPAGGTGAEGKIALINTARFREGILELKARLDALNVEFEPKNKQLQAAQDEVNNLQNKIQTQGTTVQPNVRAQWADELTQKQVTLKRLSEDLDGLAKKRYEEVSGPVYDKIGAALEQYAKQRGIAVIFEGNALSQNQALVYAVLSTDITDDFMKEYNKANPAPAGAAAPAKKP